MIAEKANTQALCSLKVIRKGKVLVSAATVAPNPNVTRVIGKAQQMRVLADENRVSQITPPSFSFTSPLLIEAVLSCCGT